MKGRTRCFFLLAWFFIAGLTTHSLAQTILTTDFSPVSVCPDAGLTVTFTTTGTFVSGNVFTAQLSDATGTFSATPASIGTTSTTRSISALIPKASVAGSAYRIRIVSSNPAKLFVSPTILTIKSTPNVPGITPPAQPYCEGDVAPALIATPATGGILNWYGQSVTGGNASSTATKPTTSLVGSTAYYVSQTVGGCESARTAITVRVNDKPDAPGTNAVTYCVGQTAVALKATPVAGATLNWYGQNETNGTPSSIAPTPLTTVPGTLTYYVSQSANGCESPRAKLTITIGSIPAAPIATGQAPYCEGVTATALTASGQNLKWYSSSGVVLPTPTIPTTTSAGTTNYSVSQTVGGCESARTSIAVVVKPKPAAPATAPAPSYCQSQTAVALSASAVTGATLIWYGTSSTGGIPSASLSVPITSQAGTVNYYVSQTVNDCESARAAIAVTIKPTPVAPTVVSPSILCQNRPATALTATPSTGAALIWYGTSATGGTPSATAPTLSTTALGSTIYYVSQSASGCEGPRRALTVTVNPVPALPTTMAPGVYCEGRTAAALTASGQNLKWYGTSATGGTGLTTATVPSTSASFIGSTPYYVTQTVNGCESDRAPIAVQVNDTPNAPGTSAIEFCQGASVPSLTLALVANATSNWYGTSAAGGTASVSPPTPSNTAAGTTVYYASQTLYGCEGPRATLSVRVKPTPVAPATSSVSLCNNATASPLTANGANLKWYDASDNLLGSVPTPNTSTVGDQLFKVSQTVENCEGPKASLTIVIKPLPTLPNISNVNYCQSQQDQPAQSVVPLSASGQNLRWYNSANNQLPFAPTPAIDKAGTQIYLVSQTVNSCEGPKATQQVTVSSVAAPAVPKSLITYCINDASAPLQALGDAGSSLQWVDPYGRVTTEAPTPPTLNTNVKPEGDAYYVYQISTNSCYSARSIIRIIVNSSPTLALLAPTANVNLGLRVPLQLKFTGSGPYSYTISDGSTGTSRLSDTTISVLPRGNTIYQVAAVSNACGLGLPGNPATAIVTVRIPTVSTSSLTAATVCAGTSLSVPFTTTGQFNPGNVFRIELASSTDTTKKYAVTESANNSPVTGKLPETLPSGQYYVRIKADNPEIGITGSDSPTMVTVRSRPTAILTGTQQIYEGVPASLTFTFGGDGPWTAAYADSSRTYSTTAVSSPYAVEVRPATTTTYRLTDVSNSCGSGTLSGTATITVLSVLAVEDNSLDPLVKTYPVPTAATLTVELNLSLVQNPAILSLTDLRGRQVLLQTTRTRQNSLDLSRQASGVYMLRIQVGDRQTVRKVLKQ